MKRLRCATLALLAIGALRAQSAPAPGAPTSPPELAQRDQAKDGADDRWSQWRFFLGKWTGEGGGRPGEGQGGFSFTLDLQDKVMLRRSFAVYAAAQGRPAFRHEDLMILRVEKPAGGPADMKADYFDNEGHIIHYTAAAQKNGRWVFLSDPAPGPRYRLTYARLADDRLEIKFEIAGPQPDAPFETYLTATATRAK